MKESDRTVDTLRKSEIHNLYSSPHISWWDVWKLAFMKGVHISVQNSCWGTWIRENS